MVRRWRRWWSRVPRIHRMIFDHVARAARRTVCVHSSPNYFPPRRREKHVTWDDFLAISLIPSRESLRSFDVVYHSRELVRQRKGGGERETEEKRDRRIHTERDGRGKEGKKKRKKKEESKRRLKRRVDRKRLVKARRDPVNRARSLSQRRRLPPRRKAVEN